MRKRAAAVSAIAAVGLMAAGGTAFADSGQSVAADGDTTSPSTSTDVAAGHEVQSVGDASNSLVGLNVPVSADLHEGVANDLNVLGQTAVPLNIPVGHVLPIGNTNDGDANVGNNNQGDVQSGSNSQTRGQSDGGVSARSGGGADVTAVARGAGAAATATANQVGGTVGDLVASATATVGNTLNVGVTTGR